MSKIDLYLSHAFGAVQKHLEREAAESDWIIMPPIPEVVVLPMLVRVRDEPWNPENLPDCSITSRLGNIVACIGSMRTVAALEKDPAVISVEASRRALGLDCAQSVPFVKADKIHQLPEKGDRALIAIIDGGIDVLHEAFRDNSGDTRILAIWDQRDSTGPGPALPGGGVSYGTLHTEHDINRYISSGVVPAPLGRDTDGHGTHVASIAAGRAAGSFAGGVAPEAKLIVVRFRIKVGPTDPFSTGYSTSYMDALAYIKQFAKDEGLPVVVNVSQGMNAGAHDGTSLLEAAFDNFSLGGSLPGHVIVKSAGNERKEKGHAKLKMGSKEFYTIEWDCSASNRGPDVVELWFKACDEFEFVLKDPKGTRTPSVTRRNPKVSGQFRISNNQYEIGFIRYHKDNGDSRLLITIENGSVSFIEQGTWVLEINSREVNSREINAWIERDDNRPINFTNHIKEEMTLSIPGTARSVITVGSVNSSMPIKLADSSSHGPTRDERDKPDLVAPGEQIEAAKGGTSNGAISKSGTSMAAPHVTGAIALLLSQREKQRFTRPGWEQINAAQIRAAITQVTQNFNGNHTPGTGFGLLDVEALLAEFL